MPVVIGGTHVDLLPGVPTPADSETAFSNNFNYFAVSLANMVVQANLKTDSWAPTLGFHVDMTELPSPPSPLDPTFANDSDTFVASFPTLRSQVNDVISALSLPCAAISALPPVPSRGSDPVNFGSESGALLAALPTFRTELNAFINALNAYNPAQPFGSHVGWRIYIEANNGNATYCGTHECQLRTTVGGGQAATGGTAFQGGPGTDAGNGVNAPWDGDLSSGSIWARTISGGYGFYFGYLFPTATAIVEMAMVGLGTQSITKFKLQHSDNTTTGSDGTWTDAFEAWEPSWADETTYRVHPQDFSGSKYKALRFLVNATVSGGFPIMSEAELHATVGGSDIANGGAAFGSTADNDHSRLWDNSTGTNFEFQNSQIPGYNAYGFPTPVAKPPEYTLTQNFATSDAWTSWKLQGSADGVTWTDLDTQSGISWSTTPQTQTFSVA